MVNALEATENFMKIRQNGNIDNICRINLNLQDKPGINNLA